MSFVVRDFNTPTNHLGDIRINVCNNKIEVILLNIHETESAHGQAWMYVRYPPNIDIYDTFLAILNRVTNDIFQEILEKGRADGDFDQNDTVESITPPYIDLVPIPEEKCSLVQNLQYIPGWSNCIPFTRESVQFLEEDNNDYDEPDIGEYVINGEILENGEFIYDKPIRSHDYYQDEDNTESETDSEADTDSS
jgi:hypothetical protein